MEFNQILKRRMELIEEVLGAKAQEYASNTDRYHNFRVAARMLNTIPEKALIGMLVKHLVSVFDIINSLDGCVRHTTLTKELVDEKIGDSINYLVLLEGLLRERIGV